MISDFHLHSCFSGDSEADLLQIIKKAVDLGMPYLCFTDHQDFDYGDDFNFSLDIDHYYDTISILRDQYASKIKLCIGVETGLEPNLSNRLDHFINSKPFDFVIGSSHLVNRTDPFYPAYWENRNDLDAFDEYFLSIRDTVKVCNNFDVYGHLDYVVRYSPNKSKNYSFFNHKDLIDEILKTIINMGKGIELNTGGMSRGLDFPNPHPDIIKRYLELGGEIITVGSDAHIPEQIGFRFDIAKKLLEQIGFKYYTIYKNRKPKFIKL